MNITRRQKEIVDFIKEFIGDKGYAPSIAEIQERFSINSPATIHQHLKNLEEKELIKRIPNRHRSIELGVAAGGGDGGVRVPVLGAIAAGSPIESYEGGETVAIPSEMAGEGTYILRVRGNSMVDDHILDGDMVIVRKADSARAGDKVVALIDGRESTLKRFFTEKGKIRLQPANSDMAPMYFRPDQVEIQGIVSGVLRRF